MPLLRVLEPEVMSGAEETGEYDDMDFSATDQLFAERAAEMARGGGRAIGLIVDLGSGNAKIPVAMSPLLPAETQICAVEMSAEMLAVAARNRAWELISPSRIHLVNADAKRVPFADRSVGMVTSNSLVHHIPDPGAVFQEIARVVHPGAPLLIRDLVRPENQQTFEQIVQTYAVSWSPLQRRLFADSLHAALTVAEVQQMLDDCGLADVKVTQITDRHWSAERG